MKFNTILFTGIFLIITSCEKADNPGTFTGAENEVKIVTVNPGHFHAFLIHRQDYHQVDPNIHIYAPDGKDVEIHIDRIEQFNDRMVGPTNWEINVYKGEDYLERMVAEKKGNVMVVAGNNARKHDYIRRAIENDINILSDKPMIIHPESFSQLKESLEMADEKGLVVNDIMPARHAITNILQKKLSHIPELFGELKKGSPEEPALIKRNILFFYKTVDGRTLIRPPWFFDVTQQGESIVDITTHLVDLIFTQSFPDEPIDYRNFDDGIEVISARSWDTQLTTDQFEMITNTSAYPDFLMPNVSQDSTLHIAANGEFVFKVRDVYGKVSALWDFTNPDGEDSHYSEMRGTKSDLIIHQNKEQDFKATLYVDPSEMADEQFELILTTALESLSDEYSGLSAEWTDFGWKINIPDEYVTTHEDHVTTVTREYLESLVAGGIPDWERTNLLTKYFITTRAYELSRK